MTKKQVQRAVERYVAPQFPALRPLGDLLVARGAGGHLLRGFSFERSQLDKNAFHLRAFAQLLSVPDDSITFGLSRELGDFCVDGDEESAFSAAAREAELRGQDFLQLVTDCRSILTNLDLIAAPTADRRLACEVRAHCLVLLRQHDEALRELDAIDNELSPPEVPYEEAAVARVRRLQAALLMSPDEAVALLTSWTEQTARALGVADLTTEQSEQR